MPGWSGAPPGTLSPRDDGMAQSADADDLALALAERYVRDRERP